MNKLHYFCTIVQAGSLTKAAELLHISQPALSKAVKTLEEEFQDKLLISEGRGVVPTDLGKRIAREATPLIEKINNLTGLSSNDDSSTLKIASFEVFSTYFLGEVISKELKGIKTEVLELTPGQIEEAVLSGKADIGMTYLPIPKAGLDILKVTSIEMGIFGLKSHKSKTLKELDFVIPNSAVGDNPSKIKGLDGWPDHKVARNIKHKVTLMETALDLCRRGECVGFFPEFVIELHNKVCKPQFKLEKIAIKQRVSAAKQSVYMIKRKSDLEGAYFKKIAKCLRIQSSIVV